MWELNLYICNWKNIRLRYLELLLASKLRIRPLSRPNFEFWILVLNNEWLLAKVKIHNSTAARPKFELRVLDFGTKEMMVASENKKSAAVAVEIGTLSFGIEEVKVVRKLDFEDWPFSESAAARLKKSKIWFRGLRIIITSSAKYRNAKYKRLTANININMARQVALTALCAVNATWRSSLYIHKQW